MTQTWSLYLVDIDAIVTVAQSPVLFFSQATLALEEAYCMLQSVSKHQLYFCK